MILIAKKRHLIHNGQNAFEEGEVFNGWFDGAHTVFLDNKRLKFSINAKLLKNYFLIFSIDDNLAQFYDTYS